MNGSLLALAAVFLAVAAVFLGRHGKASDAAAARNARFAGITLFVAGLAFFAAAFVPMLK